MKLLIIRHGETAWNKEKRMQGRCDIPLNEEGIRLARETGKGMQNIPIDLIISSPLQRALETAKLVTEGRDIPLITDERIQEMSFGDWEGECVLTSDKIDPQFMVDFYKNPAGCVVPPNGESFQDVIDRTRDFIEDIIGRPQYQDKTILIATHGAASRCLLCHFFEDKTDIWRGGVPKNCSVTTVEIENGEGRVVSLDQVFMI